MASTASSSSSDPVTDQSPSQSHPPKPPFLRPSQTHPPLFIPTAGPTPIRGGVSGGGGCGGFPPRSASDRVVTVANPAGYIRNSSPTAVVTLTQSQPQPQSRSFVFAAASADQPTGPHSMRPPVQQQPHQFVVPRQIAPPGGAHKSSSPVVSVAAAQPKVAAFATVSSAPDNKNSNDRDKSREDTIVVIHDRKVRLSEGSSGSLYSLCRPWVRNGLPQDTQPTIGDGLKLLPKPLPASIVNSHMLKQGADTNEGENSDKEDADFVEQLSGQDLLKRHVKRAKNVRARLRKERLLRIERYKHRLFLLLPTQIELIGRNEATPGS